MNSWLFRLLAGTIGVLHVAVIGLNVTNGIAHAIAYQKDGSSSYSLWAGGLCFGIAYYFALEHVNYRADCARVLKDAQS